MTSPTAKSHPLAAIALVIAAAAAFCAPPAGAQTIHVKPNDKHIQRSLDSLSPGDTLMLEPGEYLGPLMLKGLHGDPNHPITITGPEGPLEAVILGKPRANSLNIADCSYLVIRRLTFDGRDIADDAIKAGDPQRRPVHHVTVEDNTIIHHGQRQTYVGINVQVPAWDWVVRRNRILGAGTGMYFGDSEGRFPFLRGLIEYNLVQNPKGYCLQIKHHNLRGDYSEMEPSLKSEPLRTIIRHNVFTKDKTDGELGDRPNVLLDGFPDTGTGSDDRYLFYGNLVMNNPTEALFQGTGNISVHDNIFIASDLPAMKIHAHSGKAPRSIRIYHNTFLTESDPILISDATPGSEIMVAGNLLASGLARQRVRFRLGGNVVVGLWRADTVFKSLSSRIADMDLQPPRMQIARISVQDQKTMADDGADCDRDFAGARKPKELDYCGAFSQAYEHPKPLLNYAGPDATPARKAATSATTAPATTLPAATSKPGGGTPNDRPGNGKASGGGDTPAR